MKGSRITNLIVFSLILDLTEIQCDMSDVNSKYEKLGEVLRERQESLQAVLSRMEEVQKEASSVLQWLESKEEILKAMDASLSPTKTETVKAQAESNKVLCLLVSCIPAVRVLLHVLLSSLRTSLNGKSS